MITIPLAGMQAVLAGMCSISYIYLGFYFISPALKDRSARQLVYLCIFSSLWSLCYVMYYLSEDSHAKDIWQRFSFAGTLALVYILFFIIRHTKLIKNKKVERFISIAVWIPFLLISYKSLSENAVARDFPFGFWFLFMEIFITISNITSMAFLLTYLIRNKTNKSRRQALIITGSAIILMTISWLADYYFGFRNGQNLIPFWLLLWTGILLFTIKKYRFITITPELISNDIIENIEEGIILLDPGLNIIFTNNALQRLANTGHDEPASIWDLVNEKDIFAQELSRLAGNCESTFKMQINFILQDNGAKLPVDIKVKRVIDSYNDTSGYLVLVSRVRNVEYLKTHYGISGRELEVIRQLVLGRSNKEIARFLGIKESTIGHVKSIYNKIGIKNRIELIHLLFEFSISETTKPSA